MCNYEQIVPRIFSFKKKLILTIVAIVLIVMSSAVLFNRENANTADAIKITDKSTSNKVTEEEKKARRKGVEEYQNLLVGEAILQTRLAPSLQVLKNSSDIRLETGKSSSWVGASSLGTKALVLQKHIELLPVYAFAETGEDVKKITDFLRRMADLNEEIINRSDKVQRTDLLQDKSKFIPIPGQTFSLKDNNFIFLRFKEDEGRGICKRKDRDGVVDEKQLFSIRFNDPEIKWDPLHESNKFKPNPGDTFKYPGQGWVVLRILDGLSMECQSTEPDWLKTNFSDRQVFPLFWSEIKWK